MLSGKTTKDISTLITASHSMPSFSLASVNGATSETTQEHNHGHSFQGLGGRDNELPMRFIGVGIARKTAIYQESDLFYPLHEVHLSGIGRPALISFNRFGIHRNAFIYVMSELCDTHQKWMDGLFSASVAGLLCNRCAAPGCFPSYIMSDHSQIQTTFLLVTSLPVCANGHSHLGHDWHYTLFRR